MAEIGHTLMCDENRDWFIFTFTHLRYREGGGAVMKNDCTPDGYKESQKNCLNLALEEYYQSKN